MKRFVSLCCLALPLLTSAPQADPLASDFRKFLDVAFYTASGNLSAFSAVPDADEILPKDGDGWVSLDRGRLENLENISRDGNCTVHMDGDKAMVTTNIVFQDVEFTYDFSIDSSTLAEASGCVYGGLVSLLGQLVIEADVKNTSSVTARVQSLKLHRPRVLEVDEASLINLYGRFRSYVSVAIGSLLDKEIFPFLELNFGNLMNKTIAKIDFNMSPQLVVTSLIKESNSDRLTNPNSSSRKSYKKPFENKLTSRRTSSFIELVAATNTTKNWSLRDETAATYPLFSKGVAVDKYDGAIHITFAPRKGIKSINMYTSERDVSCTFTRMASYYKTRSSDKITIYKRKIPIIYRKLQTTDDITKALNRPAEENPVLKNEMITGFNDFFDVLMTKTGRRIMSHKLEPYGIPDGEEELYMTSDGSVKLAEGNVHGMDTMTQTSDPAVKRRGNTARVSVPICFANITYSFNFSANSKTYSSVSGIVRGNITQLSAELIIAANLTHPTAVTASLKSFQLLPIVEDFHTNVAYTRNVTGNFVEEVSGAVIADFEDSVVQRLEDSVAGVLDKAVASASMDMSSTLGPATQPSKPSSASSTPSLHKQQAWSWILVAQAAHIFMTIIPLLEICTLTVP